jgi:RNA polymerase sigma-70 factor (ECF subfamily)
LTEAELIRAAQGGESVALGQLLLMHRERLCQYLTSRLPSSARSLTSVDDILQQAYVAAFRSWDRFEYRGEGSFFAWLRSIVERQMINTLRDLQRRKRGGTRSRIGIQAVDAHESTYDLFQMLSAGGESPSFRLRRDEAIDAMRVALAELPDDYRQVICRRYILGERVEDTADALGRTPSAIRSIADRAKKRLRELLGSLSHYLSVR